MDKVVTKKRPGMLVYVLSIVVTAAAFAVPVADGGLQNLAAWFLALYAWPMSILFAVVIFIAPIESLPDVHPVEEILFSGVRAVSIAWLAYHGEYTYATLLSVILASSHGIAAITRKAYENQQAEAHNRQR